MHWEVRTWRDEHFTLYFKNKCTLTFAKLGLTLNHYLSLYKNTCVAILSHKSKEKISYKLVNKWKFIHIVLYVGESTQLSAYI